VDPTASAYQAVLRHVGECGEAAKLDRCQRLCARRHHQKALNLPVSRDTLRQILSVTLFETMPVPQAFPGSHDTSESAMDSNQLDLFTS
jgi:hypothetical protein